MTDCPKKRNRARGSTAAARTSSPFAIIWMFAAIVLCLLVLTDFGFGLLSSVRAYVGGESSWSKGQKDAVYHLQKYAGSGARDELRQFRAAIAVPLGDRAARLEMNKSTPELAKVLEGFVRGGIHPDDVSGMFNLYRRFGRLSFMQRAVAAWTAGDRYIVQLDEAGARLQRELESASPDEHKVESILAEVSVLNEQLTLLENRFDEDLGQASRTTYRLLRSVVLAVTPALLALGIALSTRILQQMKHAQERVNYLVLHDDLTALPNRLMFQQCLDRALGHHRRAGTQLGIVFVDLNRFKVFNDSLGHETGDELLRHFADRLRTQSRQGDMVARVGGDKFAVLIENRQSRADIGARAERLVDELSGLYALDTRECRVTVSIGISVFPSDGSDSQGLLKAAEAAMYCAKAAGQNNWLYFSPAMNVHTVERLELESDLTCALERGEFLLHYQPKVELRTGLITGTEALLRWKHPVRGLVAPMDFIPLAEETGLIVPIGEWVLASACAQNKAWQDQGLSGLSVAVNLSARQFGDPLLLAKLTRIIGVSGLEPSSLELEITESMVMADTNHAAAVLGELKAIGVQIAIDDFGTGYSSLAHLRRFPIDTLKVDRSFIRDIPHNSGDKKIARAIISMAHSLRLTVVAEGVETAEQLKFLRAQRCDIVQGYFLHRPLTAADAAEVLGRNLLERASHSAARA